MRRFGVLASVAALVGATIGSVQGGPGAFAQVGPQHNGGNNGRNIRERLHGYEEVPAVSTVGRGEFRARIANDDSSISYELSYRDLEGIVQQAHIHFGQRSVNGGISVWLCSNLASPPTPPGVQPCPTSSGTISGTITPANVVGPAGQGIAAGEFAELLRAIRAGKTYVNVHSTKFPGGEIRAQLNHGGGGDDD